MLVLPKFTNYEQPEGFEPGHVDVLVRENVAEQYGMPEVDFDNLSHMYSDELGLAAGNWTVKLFHGRWSGHVDRPLSKLSLGYHVPQTNTIHSAVWSGGYHFSLGHGPERTAGDPNDGTDTMRKLIRESVGVAEGRQQADMLTIERAKHLAGPAAVFGVLVGLGAAELVSDAAFVTAGWFSASHYVGAKSARREASEIELYDKHSRDIVFTSSPYYREDQ